MNATMLTIADAVVTVLNGATLSQPIQAARHYLPECDLKEMDQLHVTVVPAELDEEIADRARDRAEYTIHVAVQKRETQPQPPGRDTEASDGLMRLVEEIDDLFRHKPLASYPEAHWTKTENKPIYDPKHLQEHGQFTSLLAFRFRIMR